jgi:hypothetical protein
VLTPLRHFVVVGIAYFLAARVGVVLGISRGVPIFWPAAGIAVGAFITLGPNARLPVAVAVVAANIASGILIGRSLSLTITFAFFNTGEALRRSALSFPTLDRAADPRWIS